MFLFIRVGLCALGVAAVGQVFGAWGTQLGFFGWVTLMIEGIRSSVLFKHLLYYRMTCKQPTNVRKHGLFLTAMFLIVRKVVLRHIILG